MDLTPLLLDGFAELTNFVLQAGDLRFEPLILLVQPPLMFKLHGEGGQIGEVVRLTGLPAGLAPLTSARLTAARLTAAILAGARVLATAVLPTAILTAAGLI